MRFRDRLRDAIESGVIIGVKWALAVGLILIGVSYVLNDYGIVRERALNGQRAFEFLQQQVAQQQKAKPTP